MQKLVIISTLKRMFLTFNIQFSINCTEGYSQEGYTVTRKKQIILPIVIILIGAILFVVFKNMKKPPEEKPEVENIPIVAVEEVTVSPMTLKVESYGIVLPKYETEMVAQVSGQIVELSPVFIRGGFVKKGQLLARIDPNDYQAALIDAEANMASAKASLEKERAQGKVAESEWKSITDTSPTELSLRKPQLAQEIARVKSAQASILRAKRNLERTEIRAPYDSMIESRMIGLGSFVGTGTKVGKLLGTGVAQIRLPVADSQLQFLDGNGVNSTVLLEGTYSGATKEWTAKINRSEGVIDTTSRMSYLVAEIQDPYLLSSHSENTLPLRFGSYVNAHIIGQRLTQATSVPRYLVKNGRVAILDEESTLHFAVVDIVRQEGSNVIISSGLKSGDRMIVSALDYPIDGMKLALPTNKSELEEKSDADETQIASVKD